MSIQNLTKNALRKRWINARVSHAKAQAAVYAFGNSTDVFSECLSKADSNTASAYETARFALHEVEREMTRRTGDGMDWNRTLFDLPAVGLDGTVYSN